MELGSPGGALPAARGTVVDWLDMLLVLLVFIVLPLPAQTAEVERLVDEFRLQSKAPGISVAAVPQDGELFTAVRGWADLENQVAVTPLSVFRLASVSKPFTSVAAIRLAEQERLDLDAPVDRYVSSWPAKQWPVSVRQLLGNLGGVRHYREDNSDFNSTVHYNSVREALAAFSADPLAHEPGTKYLYSSYGFTLAGAAVEGAAGMPYAEAVAALVLRPAGLERMRTDDHFAVIPNRVRGYRLTPSGEVENCSLADTSSKTPGGGWVAAASDVARFARALMDGRLITAESLELMLTRQRLKDRSRTGYGLGISVNREGAPRVYSHSGGQQGASTYLVFCPELKTAVAILVNLEGVNLRPLAEAILGELNTQ